MGENTQGVGRSLLTFRERRVLLEDRISTDIDIWSSCLLNGKSLELEYVGWPVEGWEEQKRKEEKDRAQGSSSSGPGTGSGFTSWCTFLLTQI